MACNIVGILSPSLEVSLQLSFFSVLGHKPSVSL